MQYTVLFLAALAALTTAAPLTPRTTDWTLNTFTRTCSGNTCNYSYAINTNDGSTPTACKYSISGTNGTPASEESYSTSCGAFAVSSGWSGQFGPGNGFSTLAVVRNGLIAFPSYADSALQNGVAVSPDRSFVVSST